MARRSRRPNVEDLEARARRHETRRAADRLSARRRTKDDGQGLEVSAASMPQDEFEEDEGLLEDDAAEADDDGSLEGDAVEADADPEDAENDQGEERQDPEEEAGTVEEVGGGEHDAKPLFIRQGDKFAVRMRQRLRDQKSEEAFLDEFELFLRTEIVENSSLVVIQDLDLSENLISPDGFQRIFGALGDSAIRVERLRLFGSPTLNDEVCVMLSVWLEGIGETNMPKEMHLSHCAITDGGFDQLVGGLSGLPSSDGTGQLVLIRLEHNYISQEAIQSKIDGGLVLTHKKTHGNDTAKMQKTAKDARCSILAQSNGKITQKTGEPPAPEDAPLPRPIDADMEERMEQDGEHQGKRPFPSLREAYAGRRFEGTFKCYLDDKQYGFIESAEVKRILRSMGHEPKDVFVHNKQRAGFGKGDSVSFIITVGKDGKSQAQELGPPGAWTSAPNLGYGYMPPPPPGYGYPPPAFGYGYPPPPPPGWPPARPPGPLAAPSQPSRRRSRSPVPARAPARPSMAAHLQ